MSSSERKGRWALQQLPRGLHLDISQGKEVVLGRLPELNIRSLQVSRKHACVSLGPSSSPSITATGSNPLLVEKGRKRSLLKKGESMKLKEGFLIYLVPGNPDICFSVVHTPDKLPDTTVDRQAGLSFKPQSRLGCKGSQSKPQPKMVASPPKNNSVIDLSSPAAQTTPKKQTPAKHLPSPNAPSCVICTDALDEVQGELNCGHKFCFDCIQQWARIATVCPLCKGAFSSITQRDGHKHKCVTVTPKRQRIHNDDDGHWGDAAEEEEVLPCMLCDDASNEHLLLLCDGCDAPCHTYCAGLQAVPSGDWFCMVCNVERDARQGRGHRARHAGASAAAAAAASVGSDSPLSLERFALGASPAGADSAWQSARSSASGAVGPEAAWRARQMARAQDDLAASQLYVDEEGNPFIVGDDDVEFDSSQDSTLDKFDPDCLRQARSDSDSDASSVGSDAPLHPRRQRRPKRSTKKRRLKKKPRTSAAPDSTPPLSAAGGTAPLARKPPPPKVLRGASHRFGLAASGASSAATDPMEVPLVFLGGAAAAAPTPTSAPDSSATPPDFVSQNTKPRRRRGLGVSKQRPKAARSAYFS